MRRTSVFICSVVLALYCQSTTHLVSSSKITGFLLSEQIERDLVILYPRDKLRRFERLSEELIGVEGIKGVPSMEGLAAELIGKPKCLRKKYLKGLGYLQDDNMMKMVCTLLPLIGTEKRPDRLNSYIHEIARRNYPPKLVKSHRAQLDVRLHIMVGESGSIPLDADNNSNFISKLIKDIEKTFEEVFLISNNNRNK